MATLTDDRELLAQLVALGVNAREHPAGEFSMAWAMLLGCAKELALYPAELEVVLAAALERRSGSRELAIRLRAKRAAVVKVLERLRAAGAVREVAPDRWQLTPNGVAWLALWLRHPVARPACSWLLDNRVLPPARRPGRPKKPAALEELPPKS